MCVCVKEYKQKRRQLEYRTRPPAVKPDFLQRSRSLKPLYVKLAVLASVIGLILGDYILFHSILGPVS